MSLQVNQLIGFGVGGGIGGNDAYTKSLLHFDNNLTDIAAGGSHTWTTSGTVGYSTTRVFGSHSLSLAVNAYITAADSADWQFDGGVGDPFVIEARISIASASADYFVADQGSVIFYYNHVGPYLEFEAGSGLVFYTSWSPTINTFYWVTLVRVDASNAATGWRLYIDGVSQSLTKVAGNWSDTIADSASALHIGGRGAGLVDEFRVSKGTNRDLTGATITIPTQEYS